MNETINTINGIAYCQWPIFIHNCIDSDYFVIMYYGNLITSIFLFLFSVIVLIRRLRRNNGLFTDGVVAPLEGFVGFTFMCSIMRIVCSVIYIYDFIPSNYAIRGLIEDAQWVCSVLACITYLAGVFIALPKMAFFQPSSSTQRIKKLYIPSSLLIKRFYWSFVVIQYISVQASSFFSGLFRMNKNSFLTHLFYMIRSFSYGFGCLILVFGFGIYGRLLINLTKQSFELIQGQGGIVEAFGGESSIKDFVVDEKKGITRVITRKFRILNNQENKSAIELRKRRFRWRIRKMQLFNFFITFSFFYWAIQSFIIGIWYDWVFSTTSVSKNQAFSGCIVTSFIGILMVLGILLSDMTLKEDTNSATELTLSNSNNNLSQSISIG
ncbi:hypothetical protein Glove_22g190 [Diversispora epigaea]|uniref:G-protein coupled receptors family 1 profile domain-containing protein n=1 Tax=Diversispora epigaea TaxID=1348612 RepID=A0A397JTH1_9GLOM|nr:hypothetical protein Glove_22g190 [Diversispora epigaea]